MSCPAPLGDASTADDPGDQAAGLVRLTVHTASTTHALVRLLSVVRGRGGQVLDLRWHTGPAPGEGTVTLVVALDRARHLHLHAAIGRLVDVRTVLRHDPVVNGVPRTPEHDLVGSCRPSTAVQPLSASGASSVANAEASDAE